MSHLFRFGGIELDVVVDHARRGAAFAGQCFAERARREREQRDATCGERDEDRVATRTARASCCRSRRDHRCDRERREHRRQQPRGLGARAAYRAPSRARPPARPRHRTLGPRDTRAAPRSTELSAHATPLSANSASPASNTGRRPSASESDSRSRAARAANATRNTDSVSCAVSLDTSNTVASVGCAGRLMSIDNAVTAVIADSVAIQRREPIGDNAARSMPVASRILVVASRRGRTY